MSYADYMKPNPSITPTNITIEGCRIWLEARDEFNRVGVVPCIMRILEDGVKAQCNMFIFKENPMSNLKWGVFLPQSTTPTQAIASFEDRDQARDFARRTYAYNQFDIREIILPDAMPQALPPAVPTCRTGAEPDPVVVTIPASESTESPPRRVPELDRSSDPAHPFQPFSDAPAPAPAAPRLPDASPAASSPAMLSDDSDRRSQLAVRAKAMADDWNRDHPDGPRLSVVLRPSPSDAEPPHTP